eukprot:s905_g8.t1
MCRLDMQKALPDLSDGKKTLDAKAVAKKRTVRAIQVPLFFRWCCAMPAPLPPGAEGLRHKCPVTRDHLSRELQAFQRLLNDDLRETSERLRESFRTDLAPLLAMELQPQAPKASAATSSHLNPNSLNQEATQSRLVLVQPKFSSDGFGASASQLRKGAEAGFPFRQVSQSERVVDEDDEYKDNYQMGSSQANFQPDGADGADGPEPNEQSDARCAAQRLRKMDNLDKPRGHRGTRCSPSTCMSRRSDDVAEIELSCKIGELFVTVRGPPELAANFIKDISTRGQPSSSPLRSLPSEGSFDLVSEPSQPVRASQVLETRDQIAATFESCPHYLQQEGNKLSGSSTSGTDRVRRAWLAGQWASAVVAGRIHSPNRSPQLDLRPRYYVVLRAPSLEKPAIFKSARSYWAVVGDFQTSSAISHAFPSEQEAKVYLAGAGISDYDINP